MDYDPGIMESMKVSVTQQSVSKVGFTSYYVDGVDGAVGADGLTYETALKTIQAAVDKASSWAKIFVKDATYVENVVIPLGKNRIRIEGTSESGTIISPASGHAFSIASERCEITNLTAKSGTGTNKAGVYIMGDRNTVDDVMLSGTGTNPYGVHVYIGSHNEITKLTHGIGVYAGCVFEGTVALEAKHNHMHKCIVDSCSYGYQILDYAKENTIEKNTISNSTVYDAYISEAVASSIIRNRNQFNNFTTWGSDAQDLVTDYTEVDPNARLSVAATTVTFTAITNNEWAYVYKDFGAGYFSGDLNVNFDFEITASVGDTHNSVGLCFFSPTDPSTVSGWVNLTNAFGAAVFRYPGGLHYVFIEDRGTDTYDAIAISTGTTYYCNLIRTGTTLQLFVYSDSSHTTLVGTAQITQTTANACRWFLPFASNDTGDAANTMTGTTSNFDLGNVSKEAYENTATPNEWLMNYWASNTIDTNKNGICDHKTSFIGNEDAAPISSVNGWERLATIDTYWYPLLGATITGDAGNAVANKVKLLDIAYESISAKKVSSLRLWTTATLAAGEKITVELSERVDGFLTVVDSFTIDTSFDNNTYLSMMDLFGVSYIISGEIEIAAYVSANYTVDRAMKCTYHIEEASII